MFVSNMSYKVSNYLPNLGSEDMSMFSLRAIELANSDYSF